MPRMICPHCRTLGAYDDVPKTGDTGGAYACPTSTCGTFYISGTNLRRGQRFDAQRAHFVLGLDGRRMLTDEPDYFP